MSVQIKKLPKTIGLIAGNGQFPFLFAKVAKEHNIKVVSAAVYGDTSFFLRYFVDKINWFKVGDLQKLFDYFKEEQVEHVIMAGQINPDHLFDKNVTFDQETQKLFDAMRDRKADTIFGAIADRLKKENLELLDSTMLLSSYLAPKGTLTERFPTKSEEEDIKFGFEIAKAMGSLDVGQTVVVKELAIVAIEAMEGTDRAIFRGGKIARQGAVIVKTSKPEQDNRFDVPVVGPRTIITMKKCNASCLAIESGNTLIIDREKCIKLANKAGICIVCA